MPAAEMKTIGQTDQPRQVLWTGGFDSTFRVAYLLLVEKLDVQPIYVIDVDRRSTMQEFRAMASIRDTLMERSEANLLPTRIYNRMDYPIPRQLQAWWEGIKAEVHIGSQYLWLAAVADAEGWRDVEIGNHRHPGEPAGWQTVVYREPPYDASLSDREEARLFRYFRAPILHLSKQDMLQIARDHGFEDVLRLRWFCHRPIGDMACGRCHPCEIALRDDLAVDIKFVPRPLRWSVRAFRLFWRLGGNIVSAQRGKTVKF